MSAYAWTCVCERERETGRERERGKGRERDVNDPVDAKDEEKNIRITNVE